MHKAYEVCQYQPGNDMSMYKKVSKMGLQILNFGRERSISLITEYGVRRLSNKSPKSDEIAEMGVWGPLLAPNGVRRTEDSAMRSTTA